MTSEVDTTGEGKCRGSPLNERLFFTATPSKTEIKTIPIPDEHLDG